MGKMRLKIIDLSGIDNTRPYKVLIDCSYWSMRLSDARIAQTVDGASASVLGYLNSSGNYDVSIDFPPVFDAQGRPVAWNHDLQINLNGTPIRGSIFQVYMDEG